ncbi:MAG: hypothetical protein AAF196_20315 [Planctomycetota bacterium]
MRLLRFFSLSLLALTVSGTASTVSAQSDNPVAKAREGFETEIIRRFGEELSMPDPVDFDDARPGFSLIDYPSPIGDLQALIKVPEGIDGKRPAIVWVLGGLPAGGATPDLFYSPSNDSDDSAIRYDYEGLVTVYPSFRGSFGNPGRREGFYGEVDDLVAAVEFVRGLEFVDEDHVYLAGLGFGATLALLAAETGVECRGVVCCGADADFFGYDLEIFPFDVEDEEEHRMRSPVEFLDGVKSKTLVLAGSNGLFIDWTQMVEASTNENITFGLIDGADHSDHMATTNELLAAHFAAAFEDPELPVFPENSALQETYAAGVMRRTRAEDLRQLAGALEDGADLSGEHTIEFLGVKQGGEGLEEFTEAARDQGFEVDEAVPQVSEFGDTFYIVMFRGACVPSDLNAFFGLTGKARKLARDVDMSVEAWILR